MGRVPRQGCLVPGFEDTQRSQSLLPSLNKQDTLLIRVSSALCNFNVNFCNRIESAADLFRDIPRRAP